MVNILYKSGRFGFDTLKVNFSDDSAINLRVIRTTSLIGKIYCFFIRFFKLGIERFNAYPDNLTVPKIFEIYSVSKKNLERFMEQIAQNQNITPDKDWAKNVLSHYKSNIFCYVPGAAFSMRDLIYICTYQSKAVFDHGNDQQMNRNDNYSSKDVYSMKISGVCLESYPCQHECILILRNGQVGMGLLHNNDIKSLIDKFSKEKITCPPQKFAPNGWSHFFYNKRFKIEKADVLISRIFKPKFTTKIRKVLV